MKKQIGLMVSVALLTFAMVPLASAKTAKDCIAEWRADKAGMQARGMTEKAYVDSCKGDAAPTAAAPAPAAPGPTAVPKNAAAPESQKTAKDCVAEWRADKAGMQARGMTEKAYVDQCRAGTAPAATAPMAPVAPKPAAAAPTPTPAAAPPSTAQRPAPSNPSPVARQPSTPSGTTPAQSGQFADEAQAKAHCVGDTVVWANLSSKVYHFAGGKTYGATKRGAYMCEKEAVTAQFRASKNEKHP